MKTGFGVWVIAIGACSAVLAGERIDIRENWEKSTFEQRDQGKLGTCHAFSIVPLIEYMENSSIPTGSKQMAFRVSENWLVFLSTLDRLCHKQGEVKINQGWSAEDDLKRTIAMGYCGRNMFVGYDKDDPKKSVEATRSLVDLHEEVGKAVDIANFAKGEIPAELQKKFEESFGLSVTEAKAFCSGKVGEKMADLEKKIAGEPAATTERFKRRAGLRSCLNQSLAKQKELEKWKCAAKTKTWWPLEKFADKKKEREEAIKASIKEGTPMWIAMRNYPNGKPRNDQHGWHALAVTGFDDDRNELLMLNSWGPNKNLPIPYGVTDNIAQVGTLDCPDKPKVKEPALKKEPPKRMSVNPNDFKKEIATEPKGSGRSH